MAITMSWRVPALAMLLVLPVACGGGGKPSARAAAAAANAPQFKREGQLEVLSTAGALPSALLQDFERDTGCKVQLRAASDAAELLERAAQDAPDLVLASGQNAGSLVSAGLVRALDAARLPQLGAVDARLRGPAGSIVDGRRYGVAWRWQPVVLAYDETKYPVAPSSWQALYEPAAGKDGATPQVLGGGEPIAIANAALYLATTQPGLDIRDPYALNEQQYAQVLALLRQQRAAWRGTDGDVGAQAEGFRNGVAVAASTPAMVRALRAGNLPVAWTLPAGVGGAQVDIAMLHAKAAHPNCAYAWMAWALAPAAQARLADSVGALPAVATACKLEPLAGGDACARDGMALLPRLLPQRVPQARCGKARCVPYSRWTRDYLALLGE
jgi:putative spermidine/putrescine transport system substrate-binding protein